MIALIQNDRLYDYDLRTLLQAFFNNEKIVEQREGTRLQLEVVLSEKAQHRLTVSDTAGRTLLRTFTGEYTDKVAFRNVIKWQLYDMLVEYTGRQLPWGTLTGIRPVKIITGLLESGSTPEQAKKQFLETYHTTEQKADLSLRVALAEQKILASLDYENQYSIYVGIPFCPSTCLYCSFTSYPIARYQNRVEEYLDALFREIDDVAERMRKRHLISIYIGGGTPTSLSAEQLERLLYKLSTSFDLQYLKECTVEAGRADSITKDKLAVLRKPPVTRISINPQTMQNRTLQFIGRAHSVEQVLATYQMAREMGISNINMDLILGLPNENYEDVCDTLEQIRRLAPDNLTIHSLAIKRAAHLNMEREQYANVTAGATDAMLLRADEAATQMGLFPYYLYRQKNIPGNFENVGYAQPGKEGLYNILIMEEKQTIIGLGAGASSKYVMRGDTRIERTENVKEVTQYIDRIAEMIARKDAFLESE